MVWGNTVEGPAVESIQAGSQTTYAHTRANYATGMDLKKKLRSGGQESAATLRATTPVTGVIRKGGGWS